MLTFQQRQLEAKGNAAPRRTVKFCNRCGGTHKGICELVATSHGTRCRPGLIEAVERRFRERRS